MDERVENDIKRCVDYIHLNPVKHSLVSKEIDWLWSPFHRNVRMGEYDPQWDGSAELIGGEWKQLENLNHGMTGKGGWRAPTLRTTG